MGIVKFNLRRPENDNHAQQSAFASHLDDPKQRERVLHGNDSSDDSDRSEFVEVGCEYAMLGDQICNVPYDLYDLPDLKDILSLDAWNMCLTEEERFSLSAYLPDMDHQAFWLTMNELLRGENIFFGSPLEKLFQRLKGGFCSTSVAQYQEGLQMLEKQKYYHSLRSYHENMLQVFMDMKRTWSTCQPSISVEERVRIWNKRNDSKPVFAVDLNAFPADEELFTKGDKAVDTVQALKRTRCFDRKEETSHLLPSHIKGMAHAAPMTKPKGVLKIKPMMMNSPLTGVVQTLPCNSRGAVRPPPKGVLKIKPRKFPVGVQEELRSKAIGPDLTSVEPLGLHASGFSPAIQSTGKWDVENICDDSHFLIPKVKGEDNRSLKLSPHIKYLQSEDFPSRVNSAMKLQEQTLPWRSSQISKMYSHESSEVGYQNVENLRQNLGLQSREFSSGSTGSYPFVPGRCQKKRHMTPPMPTAISRISSHDEYEVFAKSSHLESSHRDPTGRGSTKSYDGDVSGVPQDGLAFPITYKRKKGYPKHNPSNTLKRATMESRFESRMPEAADCPPPEKAKSVKVKLKIWNQ